MPKPYFGKPSPQSMFKIWVSYHGDLTDHNQAFKLRLDVMVLSSVVSASLWANKPVSAETHPDGAHLAHFDSRYATITEPVLLSLVSPSISWHDKTGQNFLTQPDLKILDLTRTYFFFLPKAKKGWPVTQPVFCAGQPDLNLNYWKKNFW